MTTPTTTHLVKQPDGSYLADLGSLDESSMYTVRKRTQDEMYDPWKLDRERFGGVRIHRGRRVPPPPAAKGWMVEHASLAHPQPVSTLNDARDLIHKHARGFWFSRCQAFAEAIDVDLSDCPTPKLITFVLDQVKEHKLTVSDFWELDERPGQFTVNGESYTRRHWHRNLRVTRNSNADLFGMLRGR